jgi:hypothetical protein
LNILLAGAVLALTPSPGAAHHSFAAEYDSKNPIDLDGVVTKVEWMNPHAHIYVDAKGKDGKLYNWNLELASPNMMTRNGWKRDSIKKGDLVKVNASLARDGTPTASAQMIVTSDGRRFSFMANLNLENK